MSSTYTFTLDRDEYVGLQWGLMKKAVVLASVAVWLIGVAIGLLTADIAVLVGAAVGGPVAFVVLRQSFRRTYEGHWEASEGLRGEWTVTIDDEGITHENADGRSFVRWKAIDAARVLPGFWLFRLRTNTWLFVPRRAVGELRSERELKKRIEGYGVEVRDSGNSAWR